MKKLSLSGVSCVIRNIEGLIFLIPSRLKKFEGAIGAKLRNIVALLKKKGWYAYVLMADFPTVVVSSRPSGQFALLYGGRADVYPRVFFADSGLIMKQSTAWGASMLVHEATHVFQDHYFSRHERLDRKKKEADACREQIRFLRRCKCPRSTIDHIEPKNWLKKKRGWWEYLDSNPVTRTERYNDRRRRHCDLLHEDLVPHILF